MNNFCQFELSDLTIIVEFTMDGRHQVVDNLHSFFFAVTLLQIGGQSRLEPDFKPAHAVLL